MGFSINLVQSDEALGQVLAYCLEREGWQVTGFGKEFASLEQDTACPDLWIIDLDGEAGFMLTRQIKAKAHTIPIILTAEKENVLDRVLALEMGCEEFVIKPFLPREMVLRVQRIIERNTKRAQKNPSNLLVFQDLHVYLDSRTVIIDGSPVALTGKEYELLLFFLRNRSGALSRTEILHAVWGTDYAGSDRVVDDLIRRLRKKLRSFQVETLYGYGYRVNA